MIELGRLVLRNLVGCCSGAASFPSQGLAPRRHLNFWSEFLVVVSGGWCVVLVSVESRVGGAGSGFVAPMEVLCDESDGGVSFRCGCGGGLGAGVV